MIPFLIRSLSSSWIRTLSIIIAVLSSSLVIIFFYVIYTNTIAAISYYTLDGVDERRFTLTAPTSFFQLLDREKWGLSETVLDQIHSDKNISSYKEFIFIDIPVLGKFDIFTFSLDIDIPTFALRTSSGEVSDGIGISRSMLRYYNAQFAGSHIMFPVFEDDMILWKWVTLVFWLSKLFSLPESAGASYTSEIARIDSDYPGFWVVVPYAIAEQKMKQIGKNLSSPYKIVWYMHDVSMREDIAREYAWYDISFDEDILDEKKHIFRSIAQILFICGWGIGVILYSFLFLLFLGYFREKTAMYLLSDQYKIPLRWRMILFFTEPVFLIGISLIAVWVMTLTLQPLLIETLSTYLRSKHIFFPIMSVSSSETAFLIISNAFFLFLFLFWASFRKK